MPENQSEGAGTIVPDEDLLFGGSEPAVNQETKGQPAPTSEPHVDVSEADNIANDPASAADALGDGEGQSAADALGSDEEVEGDDAEGEGAPTTYEAFDIPEGVGTFGESVTTALGEVASELGLTQEQVQKVIDTVGPAQLESQQSSLNGVFKKWQGDTQADKEIGGANYRPSLAAAKRALKFATPGFKELLVGKNTRLANHPEVLRFLARVGNANSADRSIVRGTQATAPKVNVKDPMATPDATADMMFGSVDT
jgi:hypothetical protein